MKIDRIVAGLFFLVFALIPVNAGTANHAKQGVTSTDRNSGSGTVYHGVASWYGKPYHGRYTANGEIYNMYKVSAAHRDLPFGTVVKVTNLHNGKWLFARINDRGPFVDPHKRIIDMSMAAAQKLGMKEQGLARVRIEIVPQYASR